MAKELKQEELEARILDAFESCPDLMGGLMAVYDFGRASTESHTGDDRGA